MFKSIENFLRVRQIQRDKRNFESGFKAACLELLYYEHPMEYVFDQIMDDGINPSFDEGWKSACVVIEPLLPYIKTD